MYICLWLIKTFDHTSFIQDLQGSYEMHRYVRILIHIFMYIQIYLHIYFMYLYIHTCISCEMRRAFCMCEFFNLDPDHKPSGGQYVESEREGGRERESERECVRERS